jgi:hypothetical protein
MSGDYCVCVHGRIKSGEMERSRFTPDLYCARCEGSGFAPPPPPFTVTWPSGSTMAVNPGGPGLTSPTPPPFPVLTYTAPGCICMDVVGSSGPDPYCRHCFGSGVPGGEE